MAVVGFWHLHALIWIAALRAAAAAYKREESRKHSHWVSRKRRREMDEHGDKSKRLKVNCMLANRLAGCLEKQRLHSFFNTLAGNSRLSDKLWWSSPYQRCTISIQCEWKSPYQGMANRREVKSYGLLSCRAVGMIIGSPSEEKYTHWQFFFAVCEALY